MHDTNGFVAIVEYDGIWSVEHAVDDMRRDEGSFGAIRYRVAHVGRRMGERVVAICDVVSC